jgi:hypothetical protein
VQIGQSTRKYAPPAPPENSTRPRASGTIPRPTQHEKILAIADAEVPDLGGQEIPDAGGEHVQPQIGLEITDEAVSIARGHTRTVFQHRAEVAARTSSAGAEGEVVMRV